MYLVENKTISFLGQIHLIFSHNTKMFKSTKEGNRDEGHAQKGGTGDEGYIDSKELPRFLNNLSDTQKAGTISLNILFHLKIVSF